MRIPSRLTHKFPVLRRPLSTGSPAPILQVSTLPSGIRVATESTPGHFASVGVYVDAGSRYETAATAGSSHLLDRMTFSSSSNRSSEDFVSAIGALGGQFTSTSSRETMICQATTFAHDVPQTLDILADTMLNPVILPEELDKQRASAAWEIAEIESKPELIMPEHLHETAFKDNTLGLPLLCPQPQLTAISPELLRAYHADWYRPDRMVFAAAGVEHDAFCTLVDKTTSPSISQRYPNGVPAQNSTSSKSAQSGASAMSALLPQDPPFSVLAKQKAKYTGGARYIPDPDLEFTHLYVAYESVPVTDLDNTYALAVLQTLLGGGNAFSAGGPGKGMYSRLYTRVLNQHWKVDFCAAFNHSYFDSGLFGMGIAVTPDYAREAPRIIAQQLDSLNRAPAFGLNEEELRRAKNQLKSSLMMNLESRAMQVEDLARQVLAHGHKTSAEEMCRHIDQVTLQDLRTVSDKIIRNAEPTIVAKGSLHGLGDVRETLQKYGLAK